MTHPGDCRALADPDDLTHRAREVLRDGVSEVFASAASVAKPSDDTEMGSCIA